MNIESEEQARAYVDEQGAAKVRADLASGILGNEKRAHAFLNAELTRLDNERKFRDTVSAAKDAADRSATSAKWALVAAIAAAVAAIGQLSQLALPLQKSSLEQIAQCRIDVSRDLGPKAESKTDSDFLKKSEYLSDCMRANGFEFQGESGQSCAIAGDMKRAVKQILASCYERRPFLSRMRTHWTGN